MTAIIQKHIDAAKDRQGRIERACASMPSSQKTRLDDIHRQAEVALARVYGNRLVPEVTSRLLDGMILDASVLCTIGGGVDEMPKSSDGWNALAKQLVASDPLAQRCVDFADAKLKEGFRQEALQSLSPTSRMSMTRDNTLDSFLEESVQRRLDDRLGE
ncbi:MAG: hypothetical protein ABJ246_17380 [Paracoccaceae bacterium]